jgi:cysteine desulfurase/selenocysteine lyase
MRVNVSEIGCDFYAFSGHKMLAPGGTGVLWGRKSLLGQLAPSFYGGGMIDSVTTSGASWNAPPWKFEPGTPDACGAIALAGSEANGRRLYGAVDYLEAVGMDAVFSHEKELSAYTRKLLAEIEGVEFLCTEAQSGITAFRMAKKGREENSHIVGTLLNEMNIIARTGGHCAYPLHRYLDINDTGSIRLSYYIYNDKSDVEKICSALGSINLL